MENLIVVGDRVLIRTVNASNKSRGGLLLPPGYKEKEEVQSGYIVKTGPGYPIPIPKEEIEEPWKKKSGETSYIPLQARVGDLAIFLKSGAVEVNYKGGKYLIVPQSSILLLERDELSE
ncbi:MAG: co-chaperone GroES [Chlorobi bacterium]|nr:co-chaperone GroES [Chlorobiota bacterium]